MNLIFSQGRHVRRHPVISAVILTILTLLAAAIIWADFGLANANAGVSPGNAGLSYAETHYDNAWYDWGGTGPGFDCSGLVMESLGHATGIWLPHNTQAMISSGWLYQIRLADARRGDLLFWFAGGYAFHVEWDTAWYHTGYGAETYGWSGRVTWHPWWGAPTAWRIRLCAATAGKIT